MAKLNGVTHPRRRAHPEQRRAEILAAALEVFAERGYRGASLAAVAERAGLTQQGLLHYFPNKDALLIEVLRLRDALDTRAVPDGKGGVEDLERLVRHNATMPGLVQSFTVLSAESVTDDHPAKDFFTERYAHLRAAIAQNLAESGELPAGLSPAEAAPLLIAVMDGLQLQWLLSDERVEMAGAFRGMLGLLRGPSTG